MYTIITSFSITIFSISLPGDMQLQFTWRYVALLYLEIFILSLPGDIQLQFAWRYVALVYLKIFIFSLPENINPQFTWKYLSLVYLDISCFSLPGDMQVLFAPSRTIATVCVVACLEGRTTDCLLIFLACQSSSSQILQVSSLAVTLTFIAGTDC